MPCVEITPDDFDDMHHALGRAKPPFLEAYRNHYVAEWDSAWSAHAAATGCWHLVRRINEGRDGVYAVTADGKSALADWLRLHAPADALSPSEASAGKTEDHGARDAPLPPPPLSVHLDEGGGSSTADSELASRRPEAQRKSEEGET